MGNYIENTVTRGFHLVSGVEIGRASALFISEVSFEIDSANFCIMCLRSIRGNVNSAAPGL